MNWKGIGRELSWTNLRHYLGIHLDGLRKLTQKPSQDCWSPRRDLIPVPTECQIWVQTTWTAYYCGSITYVTLSSPSNNWQMFCVCKVIRRKLICGLLRCNYRLQRTSFLLASFLSLSRPNKHHARFSVSLNDRTPCTALPRLRLAACSLLHRTDCFIFILEHFSTLPIEIFFFSLQMTVAYM